MGRCPVRKSADATVTVNRRKLQEHALARIVNASRRHFVEVFEDGGFDVNQYITGLRCWP